MGDHSVNSNKTNREAHAQFIRNLLNDLSALDKMLERRLIERGITRIGSEQEFCLIDENWRPAKNYDKILSAIDDPHFTIELARFNLEINLDPIELKANCFSETAQLLHQFLDKARKATAQNNSKILLTGILPTISNNELELSYMTPSPRYEALNKVIKELRGSDFNLHIMGINELSITHDSVLFEACNTSFQIHLQISPEDFIHSYNWAQAIAAPVLAVSANSPLLLGRELWSETRIALFQQSLDTRSSSYALKNKQPRVTFGDAWATGSIADIFRSDISRHPILIEKNVESNSLEELEKSNIPKLQALNLYNSTVYRWNRPCYGTNNGKAHIRIENRYLPAGPTIADEIANFAFWIGLMIGRPKLSDQLPGLMDFRDAKANFVKAARTGIESVLIWKDRQIPAKELVLKELLPMAYAGLKEAKVSQEDIDHYLGIIEARTQGMNGAIWQVKSYRKLQKKLKQDDALLALTQSIYNNQLTDKPVHEWGIPESDYKPQVDSKQVGQVMSTQLFTVNENDLAELATNIMYWNNIHHVPVEDNSGKLVGLLTWSMMNHFLMQNDSDIYTVSDIMVKNVISVNIKTDIDEAIKLMQKHEIGCLPVIQNDYLVGIITRNDLTIPENGQNM
ncbi:CBS domain-containing protein [Limibacter armeniacum]|uniref:CBS domain-containing protein n=1 Tax=Limibacter armeniacum TaxID=466084 RepID=UPI002FE5DD8F